MLLEKQRPIASDLLFLDMGPRAALREDVLKAAFRFPRLFDRLLYRSYEQFIVNCPSDFLETRSKPHLHKILCVQFFLQKQMEETLKKEDRGEKHFFIKLFRGPSRICVSLVYSFSYPFQKHELMKALDNLLPGSCEVPRSFYLWHSSEYPYLFCYFEVDKLRGKELSNGQLAMIERLLKEQMLAMQPLTPAVFWPFNKEESHRQIQLLVREMTQTQEIPHLSIHFQEQTASSLEFLIYLVRPKTEAPLDLEKLPDSLYFFHYSHYEIHTPFSIEIDAFSIKMRSHPFNIRDSINLLYARRYLVRQLEMLIGPFRDYNGGLFEKQQGHFERIRLELASKIPYFDLFAEKLFYSLHPFEKWFMLPMNEIEQLFLVFSKLLSSLKPFATEATPSGLFTVAKTQNRIDFLRSGHKKTAWSAYAQLTIGDYHYECFSGKITAQIHPLFQTQEQDARTLKLVFQEGSPPSLNPHYSSSDMRCRILNKLLFEGLTRLNEKGEPVLTGAKAYAVSQDKRIYTFSLRKSYWSNGEKVTAIDYADSWRWALSDFVSHPELFFSIKNVQKYREKKVRIEEVGIQVLDPETLQVELEKPDPSFLKKLAQPFFFPLFGPQREPKWFNGPYIVQEIKPAGIKLDQNPYFTNALPHSFKKVEFQWLDDIHQIFDLFQQEKIDWIGDPLTILSLAQIRELEKQGALKTKKVARRFSLHFNTKHPLLASQFIRQALSLAIDREFICKEIFPHSLPHTQRGYSQDLAKTFFEEGLKALQVTRKNFPSLTFSYSNQTRREELALYLQKVWQETFGIRIDLKKDSWNHFRSQLEKRNFEICGTIQDTLNEHSLEYLERFEGACSWNFSQWDHLVYRTLIQNAKQELDVFKKEELKAQARHILSESIPFTPLFDYVHLYASHKRVVCSSFDEEGCIDFSQGIQI